MRRIILATLFVSTLATFISAQKRSTILGDTWVGVVVTSNEATREITLSHPDKNKTETFVGFLADGYQIKMKDGSLRELKLSDLKPGMRIRVFYKTKTQEMAGSKVKVQSIHRVDFLGSDEFTRLREALELPPSIPVTLAESSKLPVADPLKIYLSIEPPHMKDTFVQWVNKWNEEQGTKYGRIEIVADVAQAELSLVLFWGGDESVVVVPFKMYDPRGDTPEVSQATVNLVTRDAGGLKVLWLESLLVSTEKSEKSSGLIEKEIEKRMKARSKK